MRARRRELEVFTLSAVDLFASAMGAFLVITLVLMPYYQKEMRTQGDLAFLEELEGRTEAELDQSESAMNDLLEALEAAQSRKVELEAEEQIVRSELETVRTRQTDRDEQPPPPPPAPEEVAPDLAEEEVAFRFLGLKTRRTRLLFLVDMNGYLAEHQELVRETVSRALNSLQRDYAFAILGFQQLDSGPRFHRWPEGNRLALVSRSSRRDARNFMAGLAGEFRGASSVLEAFREGLDYPADAIVLVSDGLPNPDYNEGLSGSRLVRSVTLANARGIEIHTVTVGDYFKYRGTVEFMEALARANSGDFLALAK